jgi:amidase
VSAGFAPMSLGTQTGGSLIYPASKAGLYAILPTLTSVTDEGAFRISRSFDGIGGMAKTPSDLAAMTEAILLPRLRKTLLEGRGGYNSVMSGSWDGMKVGVVQSTWGGGNPDKWASELVVGSSIVTY